MKISKGLGFQGRRRFLGLVGQVATLGAFGIPPHKLGAQARDYGGPAWFPLDELYQRLRRMSKKHPESMMLQKE